MIMQAGDYLDTALVFAGIITIAMAGLLIDAGLRGLLLLADPAAAASRENRPGRIVSR